MLSGQPVTEALRAAAPVLARLGDRLYLPLPHPLLTGAQVGATVELATLQGALVGVDFRQFIPERLCRAVAARQLSWLAGRLCAEQALLANGHERAAVSGGPTGEPCWPAGFVGSITHTVLAAHAAVAPNWACNGIGIDSQPVVGLEALSDIAETCFTPTERTRWLSGAEACSRATALFCAKESFYKAAFDRVRRFIHFTEVEVVDWDLCHGAMTLSLQPSLGVVLKGTVRAHVLRDSKDVVHATVVLSAPPGG